MKKLSFEKTLYFYDSPQIIELRDFYGGCFVGVLVDDDRFVATGVAPETLRQFREGSVDLRSAMLEFGNSEWFLSASDVDLNAPIGFQVQSESLLQSGFLPDDGFTLHVVSETSDVLAEARSRNNLILDISVSPPESASEHRIRANTLAGLLFNVQKLVQHAYGAARRELSFSVRGRVEAAQGHLLDVIVPARPGSFRVLLEAVQSPDLVGQSEVARALTRIDALFTDAATPKRMLERMKENRGHFAATYLRLLKFLDEYKMGFEYAWAEPSFENPHLHSISTADVASLVDVLGGVANLGAEDIVLVGELKKADDRGQWRLANDDGTFSGTTRAGGPSLRGLRIGSLYRFSCVEEIEEIEGTGREKRTLYLQEHESFEFGNTNSRKRLDEGS